jgi:iron(III) transport system substrate-binding protein
MKGLLALHLVVLFLSPVVTAQTAWSTQHKLVIVTPIGEGLTKPVTDAFKDWYRAKTGRTIEVSTITGGTPALFARIKAWAGNPDGDVFWGGSPDMYLDLADARLLLDYLSPEATGLPAEFGRGIVLKDPAGRWYVLSFYGLGVIFNDKLLASKNLPKPRTWDELLDPKYRGLITFTRAAASGTLHNLVELFLQRRGVEEGWGYWRILAANLGKWSGRSFDVYMAVKTGEAAIGVAQAEDFAVTARAEGLPISYSYMDMNTMILSPIAILRGAPNESAAKAFVDFLLTREGQLKMAEAGFIPSRPDIKFSEVPGVKAALLKEVLGADSVWELKEKFQPLDFVLSAKRYAEVNRIFDETIFHKWEELKLAWAKIEEATSTINGYKAQGAEMRNSLAELTKAIERYKAADYSTALQLAQISIAISGPEFQEFQTSLRQRQLEQEARQQIANLQQQLQTLQAQLAAAQQQLSNTEASIRSLSIQVVVALALAILLPVGLYAYVRRQL